MIAYYLIICSFAGSAVCLPAQRTPSLTACRLLGDAYMRAGRDYSTHIYARCVAIRER